MYRVSPFTGEALKDAGDLLAHDLQLRHIRVCMHLLHQLHHSPTTQAVNYMQVLRNSMQLTFAANCQLQTDVPGCTQPSTKVELM